MKMDTREKTVRWRGNTLGRRCEQGDEHDLKRGTQSEDLVCKERITTTGGG